LIGKNTIGSRPVTLAEVSEVMEKRLVDAEEEMKRRKKEMKEKKVVEKPPEPPPAPEGEAAAEGAPAVAPVAPPVEDKSPMGLEQRTALEYAKKFAKLGKRKAAEMFEELVKMDKMKPEIAVKVVDILPTNADQVKHLFAKERVTADEKQVAAVIKLVGEYKK